MSNEDTELWLPIVGLEGRYEISSFGRVKSLWFKNNRALIRRDKIMRLNLDNYGYPIVKVGGKTHTVHRLVATAFLGGMTPSLTVNHKDGDKTNNRVGNLEWVTLGANHAHAFKLGLRKARLAKLTKEQVLEIYSRAKSGAETLAELGRAFNINLTVISKIKLRKLHRNWLPQAEDLQHA